MRTSWEITALGQVPGALFFWLFVLIGLILIAAAVVMYLRKWYGSSDDGPIIGFTLGDIRELHRSGQMNDEEFERAKGLIVAKARAQTQPTDPENAAGSAGVKVKDGTERLDGGSAG